MFYCDSLDLKRKRICCFHQVTHGYTLTQHIAFRKVVQSISAALDSEIAAAAATTGPKPAPVFISLENHCSPEGQLRLAAIMREEFGAKLVTEPVHQDNTPVTLEEMSGRILVMVEYYGIKKADVSPDDVHDEDEDEDARAHREKKAANTPAKIVPELASLGVYAQSLKPADDTWLRGELHEPLNHLVNVEERAVKGLIETGQGQGVAQHNAAHLMRIYPKGTRIGESLQQGQIYQDF